jgi:hypothetical protein
MGMALQNSQFGFRQSSITLEAENRGEILEPKGSRCYRQSSAPFACNWFGRPQYRRKRLARGEKPCRAARL